MTWFLLGGLTLGSVCAYALTPLTKLVTDEPCSNNITEFFDACLNTSIT